MPQDLNLNLNPNLNLNFNLNLNLNLDPNPNPNSTPNPTPKLKPELYRSLHRLLKPRLSLSLSLLFFSSALAQSPPAFELSVATIMRGPELIGQAPSITGWSDDSGWIYFRWLPGGQRWDAESSLYRVSATGGDPQKLDDAAADSIGVLLATGSLSPDRRMRAVSHNGDLHIIDRRTLAVRRLTHTRGVESSPVFSRDGSMLYYLSDNQLYELTLATGALRQVTDIRSGPPPSDPQEATGQRGFLERQQRELFEHIRRQHERQREQRARNREREERQPLQPTWLERDERVFGLTIEPAGAYAMITAGRAGAQSGRRTVIPYWVTASGYTEPREVRAKVGDDQPAAGRIGIASLEDGEVRWLDVAQATAPGDSAAGKRELSARFIGWNESGTTGLIGASSADFKDAWLWSFDAATGALTLLHQLHDEAWVAGPCAFWFGCSGWLPDGRTVWFTSERDGFNHLYTIAADGSGQQQLTSGRFEVHRVEISPRRDRFHLTTSEGSPHEVHFWHMNFDGGGRTRITTMPGRQDVIVSPDGNRIALVHSFANAPPELYVGENRADRPVARVTTTPTGEWRSFDWVAPEIVHIDASDGTAVPARIYRPADLGAQPNGAAVIFVHGAGYLQNVHNWWSSYYREYMFHHLLASLGYVVLDLDYRGSAGYGRDWRTAIYRHMGGKDLSDQVDGSRWLERNLGIDPERIGIYGGSYGGFITLMALFTAPDRFGAGAALRSVTDWAHYNHGYTGRILNLPQDDTTAYRQSSPIYFAEGLEDPLLIAHGMVDTNVHFSDVVRLAQRLIELGKRDWEMAVYPVEDHGFVEPTSWTDEYRRILELFERHLNPRGDPRRVS
ncbi:MAG: prolyl oligopeptidase family serine peptidase [Gemmatimonadetes bacterium]|nr:prolyl oligopeptidase family serine peptidase [Gemmatimonadota bacterium]